MKKMQRRGMKADDIHISYIGLNSCIWAWPI